MFIGHEAVAFVAKRFIPRTSLATLFMAVQFLDLLWPLGLLLGIEHVRIDRGNTALTPLDFYDYPYTHSLLFALIWSVVFGSVYYYARRDARAAWITGACVFSHWILDAIVHRPDLPLYPGGLQHVGFGLWNSIAGTLVLEIPMFAIAVAVYLRTTSARSVWGHISLWSFVAVFMAIYFSNIDHPPPDERVLAYMASGGWLRVLWGFWIDRSRQARISPG